MTDLESVASSLRALAQREPHAPECETNLPDSPMDCWTCTCDIDARRAAAQARVVLDALPGEPTIEAIEAAARVRHERGEPADALTDWEDVPAFVQKAYRESAALELKAAFELARAAGLAVLTRETTK